MWVLSHTTLTISGTNKRKYYNNKAMNHMKNKLCSARTSFRRFLANTRKICEQTFLWYHMIHEWYLINKLSRLRHLPFQSCVFSVHMRAHHHMNHEWATHREITESNLKFSERSFTARLSFSYYNAVRLQYSDAIYARTPTPYSCNRMAEQN